MIKIYLLLSYEFRQILDKWEDIEYKVLTGVVHLESEILKKRLFSGILLFLLVGFG